MKTPSIELQGVGERALGARFWFAGIAVSSAVLTAGSIHTAEAAEPTDIPSPSNGWTLERAYDFNQDTLPDSLFKRVMTPYKDSEEYSNKENVYVQDDKLVLTVVRNCLKNAKDHPTKENQTTGVCPNGTETVYTSGRVETLPILTGNYRVEVKASLEGITEDGNRVAFWTTDGGCEKGSSPYQENDIELYSSNPNTATSTTHVVCDRGELHSSYHNVAFDSEWKNRWHTFAIEVVDRTVTYFIDDEAVKVIGEDDYIDDKSNFEDADNSAFVDSFNKEKPDRVIVDTEGFNDQEAKSNAFRAADPNKPYPVQRLLIESIRISTKD